MAASTLPLTLYRSAGLSSARHGGTLDRIAANKKNPEKKDFGSARDIHHLCSGLYSCRVVRCSAFSGRPQWLILARSGRAKDYFHIEGERGISWGCGEPAFSQTTWRATYAITIVSCWKTLSRIAPRRG